MMMEETMMENEATTEPDLTTEEAEANGPDADSAAVANTPAEDASEETENDEDAVDYAALAAEDLADLKAQFPALKSLSSLAALSDPVRYAELREMGLSPKEAYLAIGGTARRKSDNRAHLLSAVPRASALANGLPSNAEMAEARRLFSNLSDAQIHRLYKKVTN